MNVYLDYAATTPPDKESVEEMLPFLGEMFGNPDSLHSYGRKAAYAVTCARDLVAQTLGVRASEVYFTSGGTEADNWAIRGIAANSPYRGIVVSAIEHHAALAAADLALRAGANVRTAKANEAGTVTAQAAEEALGMPAGLVAVMAVNNETGCIQPLREISALCRERGAVLFSDCVQAAGSLDLKEICSLCGAISLSGHKIYAPKGVGALIVKKGVPLAPLLAGGEQERGMRGGTLNVAGIVAFAGALARAQRDREENSRKIGALRDAFEERVLSALPDVRRDGENRVPGISHLTFPAKGGESMLARLDLMGVAASNGAACSAQSAKPSHVLLAMGRTEDEARKGVRFSFGKNTTEDEALYAAETVITCYRTIKGEEG